jgi:CBS domain-containing protein
MTPTFGRLAENDSVAKAATMMRDLDVASVPVCDADGRLAGVLTEHDIVVRCLAAGWDPAATSMREMVDAAPVAVSADEPVESALLTMALNGVRRLPVVEHGSLIGMLAEADVAQSLPDDALGALFAPRTG